MTEWQDISTAPKDGTEILAYVKNLKNGEPCYILLRYNGGAWWDGVWGWLEENVYYWMPLPRPPEKEHLCRPDYILINRPTPICESDINGLRINIGNQFYPVKFCPFCGEKK